MRRSVILVLAIFAGSRELALSGQPFLGETREIPGDEIVRLCVSKEGSVIAVGIRSYVRNCFLFRSDGILLFAARVDAMLPEVFCGANETLIAIDDAGLARQFAYDARTPPDARKPSIAEATQIAWSAQPDAFFDTGVISALSLLRKLPTEIQGGREGDHWVHLDWETYRTLEDFLHPRELVKCCVSPNGHYLATEWRSTFTFRRQPTERPEAATIQMINGKTGQVLWEKPRPGKLLGVNEGGEVLCSAEAGKAVSGELVILASSGETARRVTPPGQPTEAIGIGPGFFLVQCQTDEDPDGSVLATKAGSFREIPVTKFTSAASLREGIVAVGSLSGTVTGFDSRAKTRWEVGMGGPVTVRSMRDGTFLAATTASLARFDSQARKLWQVPLADLVAARERAKRPAGKEIVSTTVDADRRRLGLAPTDSARLVEKGDDPGARQFSVLLKRDAAHQIVLTWRGELHGSVRFDGGKPVEWTWPSTSSRHQVGSFILPPTSAGKADVSVTATGIHQVEVRDWQFAGQNLGRASQPTLTGGMENPIDDLRLWVFNPPYYAQMMGTRPKQADQKWIPAAIAPRALADGKMADRSMVRDRVPWWYEIRFRSPRTVSSLLVIEDLTASSSWAMEGFVSARAAKSEEWEVLARFRGRSAGRALSWAPAKVSGIRFHVTKGGNACTEVMLFGTEDSADLEEME